MRMNPMGQLLSLLTGALLAVQLFGFVAVAAGATPEVGLEMAQTAQIARRSN